MTHGGTYGGPERRNGKDRRKKKAQKGVSSQGRERVSSRAMDEASFEKHVEVCKISEELGLVFGWAIICTENGEPYYDLQGDHIPEPAMLKAAAGHMQNGGATKEQHQRGDAGRGVFSFPVTAETKEAFGLQCNRTGLMYAMRPDAEQLERFKSGELRGFSIGGRRIRDRVVEE